MDPRATRRLTPRTATKPAKSLARSSVSSTVSFATMLPHGGHFRRDQGGRKGDKTARFPPAFHSASGPSHHAPLHRTSCGPDSAASPAMTNSRLDLTSSPKELRRRHLG